MSTDDKPKQAQSMALQNYAIIGAAASNNSSQKQQKLRDNATCSSGWQRGRPKSSHINKSTSPQIFEHRASCRAQVEPGLMGKRHQTDCDIVGDLLRLTHLNLNDYDDDDDYANFVGLPKTGTQSKVKVEIYDQPKMLMEGEHQFHQQQQQQQLQSQSNSHLQHQHHDHHNHHHHQQQTQQTQSQDSHLTLILGNNGEQVNYGDNYYMVGDRHQVHQPTYFTNSSAADVNYPQPNVYTTLIDEDLTVFGGEPDEFGIGHQQNHSHGQIHDQSVDQQHDEAPLEFLELDSRPRDTMTSRFVGGDTRASTEATGSNNFKLSSCGTYLEPADSNNEHNNNNDNNNNLNPHAITRIVPLSETTGALVLPESVIHLNEPNHEGEDELSGISQSDREHFPSGKRADLQAAHLSDAQRSSGDSDQSERLRKFSARKCSQKQLEQSEFRVCEWEGCENTFDDMQQFVKHLEERHVNQNPREKNRYFCLWSNCKRNEQEFNARYKLLIHMRVHSGEKPYPCSNEDCKKTFSRLENLKIHQRSHTGEKPYKCSYENCSKSFTNSSDRIKHHKTHKDPRPYCCSQLGCSKRYTDPSSLRKHLRAHKRVIGASNTRTSSPHSQLSASNNAGHDYHQPQPHPHPQMAVSQVEHHQPASTIIKASYDPCAMFYEQEQEQEQKLTYPGPEVTYVLDQSVGSVFDGEQQQFPIRNDDKTCSVSTSGAQQVYHHLDQQGQHEQQHHHHHHQHQQQLHYHQPHHQQHNQQQQQQQRQHLSVMARSHSQFSRSWCATHHRPSRWVDGGSQVPQVQLSSGSPYSCSSSSLNSSGSQQQRQYDYHPQQSRHEPHLELQLQHPQQQQQPAEQQHFHHPEKQQPASNFSRPMTERAWQTREAQHQSLMRSLPAQPARHSALAFRDTFGAGATCSVASVSPQQPEGYYQRPQTGEPERVHWYATAEPSCYEPHG